MRDENVEEIEDVANPGLGMVVETKVESLLAASPVELNYSAICAWAGKELKLETGAGSCNGTRNTEPHVEDEKL